VASKLRKSAAKASKAVKASKAGKGIGKFASSPIGKTLIAEGVLLGAVALARSSRVRKTAAGAGAKAARLGKASAGKAASVGKASATKAARGVKSTAKAAASRLPIGKSRAKALEDKTAETVEAVAPTRRRKPEKKRVHKR
jgi:hypothetical protein